MVSDMLPGMVGFGHVPALILDFLTLTLGLASWRLARRPFIQGRLSLALPVLAMALVAVNNAAGQLPQVTYGTWFVLIFVWVGIWHPPWTAVFLAPVAAGAYLIPLVMGPPPSPYAIASVLLVIPAAVLTGETVAHYTDRVRRASAAREQLLADLSRATVTDPLTGLGNRRLGEMLLETLEPGDAVAILDLDHFKKVNDRHGHPEGDRLLRQLADYLSGSLRDSDAVARMGGEEFMLVLRGPGLAAIDIVSKLISSWRTKKPLATMSAGVAVHSLRTQFAATYAAADQALYAAKNSGRDRAISAATGDQPERQGWAGIDPRPSRRPQMPSKKVPAIEIRVPDTVRITTEGRRGP
jgi:diguanylate cyclase (GGDEF)-like protein